MLSNMRGVRHQGRQFRHRAAFAICLCALPLAAGQAYAQLCTTQARMTAGQRLALGTAAYGLAQAVQQGDAARVRADTVASYAGDANQTAYLVRSTGTHLSGDSLRVTQVYQLDAQARGAGDTGEADFSCALSGTVAETDFGIAGLPKGMFAFAMVEAAGPSPWLLAFLLEQEGGAWKMAGFYPHPRSAAGHDGLWYWTTARADTKADKPWLAWLLYGTADQLLRPAAFVSSGNLDRLLTEQRSAAPQALTDGVSEARPLTLVGSGGTTYPFTELRAQPGDDGHGLNLSLRLGGTGPAAAAGGTERAVSAARALLAAHPELQGAFTNVIVVAPSDTGTPVVVEKPMSELGTVSR